MKTLSAKISYTQTGMYGRFAVAPLLDNQLRVTRTRNCGFTLIEVLIAIAIFAVLSLLAFGGLQSVISGKQQTEEALLRLRELQLTMNHFQRDFEQLVPRDARDELGGTLYRLSAGLDSDLLVQFTRGGWPNPAGLIRSHLQRVAYRLDDNNLIRMSWPYVDRAQDGQAIENILITHIKDVQFRFLDNDNEWQDNWPSAEVQASGGEPPQPRAVEVTLQMEDWGDIVRIFRVPG